MGNILYLGIDMIIWGWHQNASLGVKCGGALVQTLAGTEEGGWWDGGITRNIPPGNCRTLASHILFLSGSLLHHVALTEA